MAVIVRCPNPECGKSYSVRESHLGRTFACNGCGRTFTLSESGRETSRPAARSDTSKAPSAPGLAAVPEKLGRFEIRSRLGSGAFGSVYRAYDPVLDREVALKVPHAGTLHTETDKTRFLQEAKAAGRLRHPNIVPVYEAGVDGDHYFIASAFIEGQTLEERIERERPDFRQAAQIVTQLAGALDYAHRLGIVHRDVKPANTMVDAAGDPLLMDFGLARFEERESKLTRDGTVLGTPAYMAPEQASARHEQVGPASDQYALGVVLYELLCGQTPFSGPPGLVISLVINLEPPSPRSIDARIPRDLETICAKAMSKGREQRYTDCGDLADDLRRWQEGEPIHARQIGPVERFWRWCRRNPVVAGLSATAALLLLIVAIVTSVAYVRTSRALATVAAERRQRALAQVDALLRAEIGQVPYIIESLESSRDEVAPRLGDLLEQPDLSPEEHLRVSLAVLSEDEGQVPYLRDRLLSAEPAELIVVRDALVPNRDALIGDLWQIAEDSTSDKEQRFRAACALAAYDTDSPRWSEIVDEVADVLVAENPLMAGTWTEALRPVRLALTASLQGIYADTERPESERTLATGILVDYAADQPEVLAALIMEADVKQFGAIMPKLKARGASAVAILESELSTHLAPEATEDEKEKLAKRQANAALALLEMNQPAEVWPLLKHSPDPRARTYLIHRLEPFGADPMVIVNRLGQEADVSVRRALMLSLGEFGEDRLAAAARQSLIPTLLATYRDDLDAGIHSASGWLLRRWGQEQQVKKIEGELATGTVEGNRQWYVNRQGHTMVIIAGPAEFTMGSPATETGRQEDEQEHRRRIGRSFELAAKEVSIQQYETFRKDANLPSITGTERYTPTADCPMISVMWYEAAQYCNWLSGQEGIGEDQWCYLPASSGEYAEGMRPASDFLSRTGYRLPTEAEWEYACRAFAVTSRHYGQTEELLGKYAWYQDNSNSRSWPVGSLKPNDLGFFDIHGNVWDWCQDRYVVYPQSPTGQVVEDSPGTQAVTDREGRVLRGGSFNNLPMLVWSAHRYWAQPIFRNYVSGIRVARTYR